MAVIKFDTVSVEMGLNNDVPMIWVADFGQSLFCIASRRCMGFTLVGAMYTCG
jgi:hydrogenase-4 membrane subunit HyfE